MSTPEYANLITSEHSGQPNFTATLKLLADGVGSITTLIDSFPTLFDLDNAINHELDVDGQWIGFSRTVGGILLVQFFGFGDDPSALGFGELGNPAVGGRFYELGEDTSSTATLANPEYRLVLRAKILQNDWDGSAAQFQNALYDILGIPIATTPFIFDPGNNVVVIAPQQPVDPVLSQLLVSYDLLPRAAGVRYQFMFPNLPPFAWTTAGTAAASGTTVSKPSGINAWDSAAYIAQPTTRVYMTWTVGASTDLMGGFASNPSGSPSYTTLNIALYTTGGNQILVYENGTNIPGPGVSGSFGTFLPGDTFGVYWDGKSAVYLHNNKVFYSHTPVSPGALSPMFVTYTVGAQASNINIWTGQ